MQKKFKNITIYCGDSDQGDKVLVEDEGCLYSNYTRSITHRLFRKCPLWTYMRILKIAIYLTNLNE